MIRYMLSLTLAVMVFSANAGIAAELAVEPDKENVVASRLEGAWQPHQSLTKRLTGDVEPRAGELPFKGKFTFVSDPTVAEKIPDEYVKILTERKLRIYLAGYIKTDGEARPFIVTNFRGNPHVLVWLDRDGDPFGNGESVNVMLAVADSKKNDLLFIGGDLNNQSFSAYERADTHGSSY